MFVATDFRTYIDRVFMLAHRDATTAELEKWNESKW